MKKPSLALTTTAKSLFFSAFSLALAAPTYSHAQQGASDPAGSVPASYGNAGSTGLPRITSHRVEPRNPAANGYSNGNANSNGDYQAATKRAAFEQYVDTVTGARLSVFGSDLFKNVPNTFAPADAVQVNPDYLVGSGDELQIRGWGMVDIDVNATVDRSGAIYIPRVGSVRVSGIKYRELQGHLKKAIGRFFSNFELTASISQTRAVQVYVVGHAARPGTYTLSAMSTLLNALFSSGGPDATGSMRNIHVKRGGETVTTFDAYDMLIQGDKSRDITLQDGDVIFIPEVGPLVALTGNVKNPAVFELKGESSIADVVRWAGGFDSAAEGKQVVVEKNINNNYVTVAEVIADEEGRSGRLAGIPVRPADVLRVFSPGSVPVEAQVRNEYVRVAGEVKQSGAFQIKKGETLRELIARLGGVAENGYLYAMRLNRESVRVAQQARLNEVADRFEREVETSARNRIGGAADKDNVSIIAAEIERQRQVAQKMRAVKAEGRIVLELPDQDAQMKHLPDLVLQDGDSIFIPRRPGTVDVLGAVFQASSFVHKPRRTVNDYLVLAGGPTATADTSEIYLLRADGTARSSHSNGWLSTLGGYPVSPGDTIVVPEEIVRTSWTQTLKEWTTILAQFGLGAAGIKVLRD